MGQQDAGATSYTWFREIIGNFVCHLVFDFVRRAESGANGDSPGGDIAIVATEFHGNSGAYPQQHRDPDDGFHADSHAFSKQYANTANHATANGH